MTELVRFSVCHGHSVGVEVDGPAYDEGSAPVGRRRPGDLSEIFEARLGEVRDAAEAALAILREASSPDEIKLSLGVKLTQEAGAIIARTALEGNLAVELVWKRTAA